MKSQVLCVFCNKQTGFSKFLYVTGSASGVHQTINCEHCGEKLIVKTAMATGRAIKPEVVNVRKGES